MIENIRELQELKTSQEHSISQLEKQNKSFKSKIEDQSTLLNKNDSETRQFLQ